MGSRRRIFGVDGGFFPSMEDDFKSAMNFTVEHGMPPARDEDYGDIADEPFSKDFVQFEEERTERIQSGGMPLQEDDIFMTRKKGRPMQGNIFEDDDNKIGQNIFGTAKTRPKSKKSFWKI